MPLASMQKLLFGAKRLALVISAILLGWIAPLSAIGQQSYEAAADEVPPAEAECIQQAILLRLTACNPNAPPCAGASIVLHDDQPGNRARQGGDVWLILVAYWPSPHSAWAILYAYAGGDPINRWDPSGLRWIWNTETFDWEWQQHYTAPENIYGESGDRFVGAPVPHDDGPSPGDAFKPSIIPGNGTAWASLPATNHGSYNPIYLGDLRTALAPIDGLSGAAGGEASYFGHLDGLYAQLYTSTMAGGDFAGFAIADEAMANAVLNEYADLMLAPAPPLVSGAAVMDGVQGGLDLAGFIPGLGAIPDLASAGISSLRGNQVDALTSLAAAIPLAGDAGKVSKEVADGAATVLRRSRWVDENIGLVRALEGAGPLSGRAMDVIDAARAETTLVGKVRILRQGDVFNAQQRRYLIENFVICFPAGTQVVTRDGPKAIEALQEGDEVLSWDEATGEQGFRPVVRTFQNQTEELVHLRVQVDGEARLIRCTAEHPFWTDAHGWVSAARLSTGMQVDLADGGNADVVEVSIQPDACAVYNVEIEGWHTYYVLPDGVVDVQLAVLAHNRCRGGTARLRGALGAPPAIPGGAPANFSWQAHHIFPQHLHSTPLGKQLQAWGIDLEGAMNGIYLPSHAVPGLAASLHRGGHNAAYYNLVVQAMSGANDPASAMRALQRLRAGLQSGAIRLNAAR